MRSCQPNRFRLALLSVIAVSALFLYTPSLSAQADPGPRPAGITNAPFCPVAFAPAKFTDFCIDTNQPPSNPAQPPADGAGNVVANGGALTTFWFQAIPVFETFATVTTPVAPPTTILGLGPSFNAEHCFECHSQPTVGGSSGGRVTITTPSVANRLFVSTINPFLETIGTNAFVHNPEVDSASHDGATNSLPCFLNATGTCITNGDFVSSNFFLGPVVETRFIKAVAAVPAAHTDAVPAGGVAELFTFAGRSDLPPGNTCQISQEDFATQLADDNISFRIPTPTFGLGFVENTTDPTLITNALAAKTAAGGGFGTITFNVFNHSGNDGTITRFGWKAQNKSLLMFSGEAANVEMGVTNELFPNEKTWGGNTSIQNCINFNTYPEDQILNTEQTVIPPVTGDPSQISSVIQNLAVFMRLNGAPAQCNWNSPANTCTPLGPAVLEGQCLFGQLNTAVACPTPIAPLTSVGIGCVLCHTDKLMTGPSLAGSLNNAPFNPYSDFALHHMGLGDADSVTQGLAGGDQFRTAPLWGVGQRFFFFHDGRWTNLLDAIVQGHCTNPVAAAPFPASEACTVVNNFNALTAVQKQDILDFLRSL
jgi:CxxC motif-containing protein (DUF1111 family)